jgi:hypothetical protein
VNPHSGLLDFSEAAVVQLFVIYIHMPVYENLNCCVPEDMQM